MTERQGFQSRVRSWMQACFGLSISADKVERNHRFLEESLELVQAGGCSREECYQLVDYVFGRPIGELAQEVGGVRVTLAALCEANGIDEEQAAEAELARVWRKIDVIRAKQAAKPRGSVLPISPSYLPSAGGDSEAETRATAHYEDVLVLRRRLGEKTELAKELAEALEEVVGCFEAASAEGLDEKLADANVHDLGSLADLVNRRLLHALPVAQGALAKAKAAGLV